MNPNNHNNALIKFGPDLLLVKLCIGIVMNIKHPLRKSAFPLSAFLLSINRIFTELPDKIRTFDLFHFQNGNFPLNYVSLINLKGK